MAAKRFIITELEDKTFSLVDKKDGAKLMHDASFENVYAKAKEIASNQIIYGITNIVNPDERHPKFRTFKTPVRCAYEFENNK